MRNIFIGFTFFSVFEATSWVVLYADTGGERDFRPRDARQRKHFCSEGEPDNIIYLQQGHYL